MTMKIVSIKKVSFFIVPLITLLGIYSLTMNKPSLSSFKQNSVHAVSLAGAETSMNFKIVDEKTIMINNIPSIVKKEYIKSLREGANKQVISSQADSLIKISRIWADFFPANTSNQPI
ncbi:hypothetical protein [Klebsiella pneumoniae]|uniref:hypothetical protein n=1 Tax=Klebsiella pneumoniae TaxID=573 RepID=UPI0023DAC37E|nr:hypothetical protein [Klebsiella pneumoniae]MDF1956418.1 hypothetical protein [Klebsiella pneumoniae]